ncbi:MAG: class I SAM-dependent methyltransferase [Desulfovibrionaceae bacterium]|nr:class I SAM-dependent methyltransferase [Desulfovibrionaceae bacterium]
MSKFGILTKLNFLQDIASALVAWVNPAIVHNLEKYYALKKVHYLSAIEDISGDYLEFGVFTGSSFCHSLRCCKNLLKLNPELDKTKFYGFDSFAGFGELSEEDEHPFYKDENFATSLKAVEKRAAGAAGGLGWRLVPGFFSESLKAGAENLGISRARIIFIDSDTYASANDALTFCIPITQQGTYVVLDDFFSYRGSKKAGVARAFDEFLENGGFEARPVLNYGNGGAVYVISEIKN